MCWRGGEGEATLSLSERNLEGGQGYCPANVMGTKNNGLSTRNTIFAGTREARLEVF